MEFEPSVPSRWQYRFKPDYWTHVLIDPNQGVYFFKYENSEWFLHHGKWIPAKMGKEWYESRWLIGNDFKRDDELS